MICKVNIINEIKDDVINEASVIYLKGMKKRRKINEVLNVLYKDGLIPDSKTKKKLYWKKKKKKEKIIEEKENDKFLALELLNDDKDNVNILNSSDILEEESFDDLNSSEVKFEKKIKRKSSMKKKFVNKEINAIQEALKIKRKKILLSTENDICDI
jgi:hypothetical protein